MATLCFDTSARKPGSKATRRFSATTTYYQYPLMDHRGTTYAIADVNGNIQTSYVMDAFGRPLAGTGGADPNVPNELIYQTNWLTLLIGGETYGISRYRITLAPLGIFLSRDFLRFLNLYREWSNNPVGQVDWNGLAGIDEDNSGLGGVEITNLGLSKPAGSEPKSSSVTNYTEQAEDPTQKWNVEVKVSTYSDTSKTGKGAFATRAINLGLMAEGEDPSKFNEAQVNERDMMALALLGKGIDGVTVARFGEIKVSCTGGNNNWVPCTIEVNK